MLKQKTVLLTLTICAMVWLAISQPAYAQISEFKITADDGTENAEFGFTVSISGDHAVVGAHADDNFIGSAYVFKRTGTSWTQEDKLLPFDGDIADAFGWSVSISGDYVIVGAIQNDENEFDADAGSAYVFKRTGTSWTQEAILFPSDNVPFQ